ncbi:hypothetical protein BH11PLA2_BH11PLA2_00660 [soil metagenome]
MLLSTITLLAAKPTDAEVAAAQAAAQSAGMGCSLACFGVIIALAAVMIISAWKIFTKAGQPGWYSLIPIYNSYIMTCEIAKKDVMWFILQFVPIVGIYAAFMTTMEIAKKFGKSEGFGIGLCFLPFIFFPMLAFGDAEYESRGGNRRRFASTDDDEDYDDRPKKRRRDEDDDYDDRPRKPRKPRGDFDDE